MLDSARTRYRQARLAPHWLFVALCLVCGSQRSWGSDDLKVERGQLTFDAEGTEGGSFHSRTPHVPSPTSGVTIGRGYDLKEKSKAQVIKDLTAAGLPIAVAERYAAGVGLSGEKAREFIRTAALPEIGTSEQKKLFEISYDAAAADVKRICMKADVVKKYGATDWDSLLPTIKDLLVDLRFRGDYTPRVRERIQKFVVGNNLNGLAADLADRTKWQAVPEDRFNRRNDPMGSNRAIGQEPSLVPQIGSIIRGYGKKEKNPEWEQAAKLQDLWLNHNKHAAVPKPPDTFDFSVVVRSDTTKITMDWILKREVDSDGRAQKAYDDLKKAISADSEKKMQAVIEKQVNRLFAKTSANSVELGSVKLDAKTDIRAFHAQQAQYRAVKEDITTPIDPLLGALGSFDFYAIPIGKAEKLADGTCRVDITEFVIYVIDSFDFVGEQKLGFWKAPDSIAKLNPPLGATWMTNKSYRDYRDSSAANGKGGDFILITDAKTEKIAKTFTFTPEATANGTWVSSDAKKRFALAIKEESVEWTETSPETGITYKATLKVTKKGDECRIERPNNTTEILKMLGFQDVKLQDAILKAEPHPSTLVFQLKKGELLAKWSGIRVKKTPKGEFSSLVQPEDPANKPGDYTLIRSK